MSARPPRPVRGQERGERKRGERRVVAWAKAGGAMGARVADAVARASAHRDEEVGDVEEGALDEVDLNRHRVGVEGAVRDVHRHGDGGGDVRLVKDALADVIRAHIDPDLGVSQEVHLDDLGVVLGDVEAGTLRSQGRRAV